MGESLDDLQMRVDPATFSGSTTMKERPFIAQATD
jgi:hypothetical protein